jgi:cell division protein FtsW
METITQIFRRYFVLKGDRVLWGLTILLMCISLLVVFSSTGKYAYVEYDGDTNAPLLKHFAFFILGFGAILVLQSMHYKYFISLAMAVWILAVAGLVIAQMFPTNINDAARWVRIPGIGLTVQPSEFAKLGMVMMVARFIAFEQKDGHCENKTLIRVFGYTFPLLALIFPENFSTSVLLLLVCLVMLFIGRLRMKVMGIVLLVFFVLGAGGLWAIYNVPQLEKIKRTETIKSRIEGRDSFQADQSKIAIAQGGLYGVGIGQSTQRDFLPNPFSDYSYAIIIEEYGSLIGGVSMLLLYLIILYRVGVIIRRCTRMFPALLVAGLGCTIVFQALIHVFVSVGLFPVTGQPLPFVSMGGTSILVTGCALGMIQSVAHTFSEAGQREEEERHQRMLAALESKRERLEHMAAESTYTDNI